MKKAAHLVLMVILTILAYALYVPIAALYIVSWPFRLIGWLLKSAAQTSTLLQIKMDGWARLQLAWAYGYPTVAAYDAHIAEDKRAEKAAVQAAARARAVPADESDESAEPAFAP